MCKQENARFSNTAMYVCNHVRFNTSSQLLALGHDPVHVKRCIFARSSVTMTKTELIW